MRHCAFAVSLLLVLVAPPAWASFADGQARFQGGDYKGALAQWLPLAEEGDARAQYSVGILYEQGLGMAQDLNQAFAWYGRASAQGYGPATAALRALQPRMAAPPQAPAPAAAPRAPSRPPRALTEKEQIEQVVQSVLHQANLQLRAGRLDYSTVEVDEVADGFQVVVRDLMLSESLQERLEIGDVTAHVARDGDRYYKIDFQLPPTLRGFEAGASGPTQISIPRQSNLLVWDRDLELVIDCDLLWEGLTVVSPDNVELAHVRKLAVVSDLVDKEGLWSGPVSFRMEGIGFQEAGQGSIKLGAIGFRTLVENLDMVRYSELSRAVTVGGQTPEQTLGQLRSLFTGVALEFEMSGLRVAVADGPNAALDKATYRIGIGGFDKPLSTIDMGYSHAGLGGQPPEVPELAPRDARIHFVFERLPMQMLLQTGLAAVMEYMFFGEVGQQGDVMNQLRLGLADAGTRFHILDGRFDAPKLLLTIAGVLSADAQALWGVSGSVNVTVRGVDNLAALIQPQGAPPPAQPARPSPLEMLRSMGKLDADGQTYIYDFELNRQGQFLVNGQDATPLVMALFAG